MKGLHIKLFNNVRHVFWLLLSDRITIIDRNIDNMKKFVILMLAVWVLSDSNQMDTVASYKIPKKNRIEKAAEQELLMTQDPELNAIPRERLLAAHKQITAASKTRSAADLMWTERGPNNVGGRVRAAIFDKNDTSQKTVFAAGVSGGLWKTSNIESSDPNWIQIDDFFGNLSVCAISQDPNNPNIMYFGTGEGYFEVDASPGMGIWKSSNGGSSWSHIAASSIFKYIQDLVVLDNGNIIVSSEKGVYRSTNGGSAWSKVLGTGKYAAVNDANDLELASDGTLYATMGIFSTDGIYKSSNNGFSWSKLTTGLPSTGYERIQISAAPSDPDILYSLYQDKVTNACKGIYKSNNGGATWQTMSNPGAVGMDNFARSQAWYNLSLDVDPNNPNTLMIGGIDLLKSTNSGMTWSQISQWGGLMGKQKVHADQHLILYSDSSSKILFGNDGGIWYTTNGSNTTPNIYAKNKGLNITQFYACTAHPTAGSNYFLAGAQDNGTQRFTQSGVNTTQEASGGDGAFCFIDEDNPNIQITSYVFNSYFVSTNGGTSFTNKTLNSNGLFANPTCYDSQTNLLYSSNTAGSILRWNNPTGNTPNTTSVGISGMSGQQASCLKMSPSVANRCYIGTASGDVFLADNINSGSSKTATRIRNASSGYISSIDIDPNDEAHILIAYSNYGIVSIYETLNTGVTWNSVEGNLPDMPVRYVMFHPESTDKAIIGTELGVFITNNLNNQSTQWTSSNYGLANVRVDMIHHRKSDNLLVAATHGRGLYTTSSLGSSKGGFDSDEMLTMEDPQSSNYGNCTEDYKTLSIPVSISALPTGGASIQVSIVSGSTNATVNKDYTLATSNLSYTSGTNLTQNISLKIIDDAIYENPETIMLKLTSSKIDLTDKDVLTITLNDNDADPMPGSGASFVAIGTGSTTSRDYPFGGYYEDGRTQMLYKASELSMMGLQAGPISALSLNVSSKTSDAPFKGFSVKLMHTNLNTVNLANAPFETGGNVVYQSDLNTQNGWNQINFNTPFYWNGTDNLMIEYCYNNSHWSDDDKVYSTTTSFNSVQYRQADSNVGCSMPTVQKISKVRPNIKLHQSAATSICSDLCTKSSYVAGNQTANFYKNGSIIATIKNLTSSPLACIDMELDRSSGSSTGVVNADWLDGAPISKKTFYVDAVSNGSYEITLYYTAGELAGWDNSEALSIIKTEVPIDNYNGQGYILADDGATEVMDMGNGAKAYKAQFTGFSGFGLVDDSLIGMTTTLPVVIRDIKAEPLPGYNLVTWEVEQEIDLSHYIIEKSFDARVFEESATIEAQDLSTYEWRDTELTFSSQEYYYRLKSVDRNGAFEYTEVVSAYVEDNRSYQLVAYPNPFADRVTIAKSGDFQITKMTLTNVTGQVIKSFDRIFGNEIQTMEIDMASLTPGIYILQYASDHNIEGRLKLIKN